MEQDRLARALARISGLRDRLQEEDARNRIAVLYVEDYHKALKELATSELNLDEFKVRPEDFANGGVEWALFLSKLDAAIAYLSDTVATSYRFARIVMDGYSLEELARGYSSSASIRQDPQPASSTGSRIPRIEKTVPESWTKIADEVIWRKRLLMAATQELRDRQIPNDFALATVDSITLR